VVSTLVSMSVATICTGGVIVLKASQAVMARL
jgi:hypothetical protein